MKPKPAEYGFWKSPFTSDLIVKESVRLGEPAIDGGDIYWLEGRPAEKGRSVLVRRNSDGSRNDVSPDPFNVRTRVHEYGGGAYAVDRGTVFFSNFRDQRIYKIPPGNEPEPLTPDRPWRYADAAVDHGRGRLTAVREDHSDPSREPANTIAAIAFEPNAKQDILVSGADFYSNPRLSPDGSRMCWIEWRHPQMPWDGAELWVAEFATNGSLAARRKVAGGPEDSIFQPEWSPSGELFFVSDRNGFWNLYRDSPSGAVAVHELEAEFGLPQWVFRMSTYGFTGAGRLICTYTQSGEWRLASIDPSSSGLDPIETPYTDIDGLQAAGNTVVFRGASPSEPAAIVKLDLLSGETEILQNSAILANGLRSYLSAPRPISFPTTGGQTAHAFYYPPRNPEFEAPEDEKPPLIVMSHGGPTGAASSALSLSKQYWTSRGFAVVDVNYSGSSGYGREYRKRLNRNWGIADVNDCANAALYIVGRGLADRDRLIIKGGSAGGYTTMACLAFRDIFAVGASYYGVSDLEALARDTHKFESRYLDRLIGPYPGARDTYIERSPIHAVDRLSSPMIFFQGSEDRVVPQNQTETMIEALRSKGIPVAYLLFEGEQHGLRDGDNVKRALDAELYFYATILLKKGIRF